MGARAVAAWTATDQTRLSAAIARQDHDRARLLLRKRVRWSLSEQGFEIRGDGLRLPASPDKDEIRKMHAGAVARLLALARPGLARHETRLIGRLAQGNTVDPERMRIRLVQVVPNTEDELLFRWARLHWSVPTSSGYGRRLRFLVIDDHNNALVGVIGLGDPVFALKPRDAWIGWDRAQRMVALRNVLDAFVVGAVPPYSLLLGGKLVASLLACKEICDAFDTAYGEARSVLTGRTGASLALITTASALGRSSVYARLALDGQRLMHRTGETLGSGDFHFSADLYDDVTAYAATFCVPTAKRSEWGRGFRNRREVVRRVLSDLELPDRMIYHGVRRELYACPTGPEALPFLRGEADSPGSWKRLAADVGWAAQQRWMIRRAARDRGWQNFEPESWRLWPAAPSHS